MTLKKAEVKTSNIESLTNQEVQDIKEFLGITGGLEGTNYIYVKADGTDTENATELQAAYDEAITRTPTATNRITIVAGNGYYNFAADFVMNTEFIDLVSLDGNRSIIFNGTGTINITANDVFVKGVNVTTKLFTIGNDLSLLKLENCQGGNDSFVINGTASGTFNNCQGGDGSFGAGGTASGTFIDCTGGFRSFGSFGTAPGTFTNCQAANESFGFGGTASGTFTNCVGGISSFGFGGTASGTFTNCEGGDGSFGFQGTASGTFINCTEIGVIKTQTYASNEVHFRNFPASQFGTTASPRTGNVTSTNVKAAKNQVQKMYHDDIVAPTLPNTWKKRGTDNYLVDAAASGKVNVIFVEYISDTRQAYWITQEIL